ncbi:MAG: hypothetical protein QW566_00845 [Candidatus Jordarchaeales archaeon]
MAEKVKVTLLLSGELVRRVKSRLALDGKSLSGVVEELLSVYDGLRFLDELCEELGLESRFYTGLEVKADRLKRLRAEDVTREVRDEREERLLGH